MQKVAERHPITIDQMGESALLVTLGTGISQAVNGRVLGLASRLRLLEIDGVLEIIPAYASVLVTFDDAQIDEHVLTEQIEGAFITQYAEQAAPTRRHIIPAVYGGEYGPDLESVAELKGLSSVEVVKRHSQASYRVYFLGFMPGFPYLGGLDPSIAAPRLPSPRVRVPAGSVGIAGDQTGIYPLASPGGWRLIGRTNVALWDAGREPPALLTPGDEVQFVPIDAEALTFDPTHAPSSYQESEGSPVFEVEDPGALTTIQDMGRPGYAHLGLSTGGAMDTAALEVVNQLVGNAPTAAVLEMTWSGPTLRALTTTVIAVAGADFGCHVDDMRVPTGVSWLVRAGSTVRFARHGGTNAGARSYLAVAGGFSVEPVLGSRSTYLSGRFGGLEGRALKAGDILHAGRHGKSPAELAGRMLDLISIPTGGVTTLRYVPYLGTGSVSVSEELRDRTNALVYDVSPASDRMGVRLLPESGDILSGSTGELTSFGVVRGAIQLPPSGTPVVLGADHQTTGGYPLLGVVAKADWSGIAQLGPGEKVVLQPISIEEARVARRSSVPIS